MLISQKLVEWSWASIFAFILIERAGVLLNFYSEIPKLLLLSLKYFAILLSLAASIKYQPSVKWKFKPLLLLPLFLISMQALLNITDYTSFQEYQTFFSWLFVTLNCYLVGLKFHLLLRLLLLSNSISLSSVLLGSKAWSIDGRLEFLNLPGRLTGLFGQPNVTALAAAFTIVFLWGKNANRLNLSVAFLVLGLSASLTVISGLVLAGIYLLVFKRFGKLLQLFFHISLLTVSILYPFLIHFSQIDSIEARRFTGRVAIWEWTIQKISEPSFIPQIDLYSKLYQSDSSHIVWFHAHNQFLMNWATGGLSAAMFGICLLLGIVLAAAQGKATSSLKFAIVTILLLNVIFEVPLTLDKLDARLLLLIFVISSISPKESPPTKIHP